MGYRVTTPEPGYNGQSCGITFAGGVAENVPDGPALRYFRGAGYGVEDASAAAPESEPGEPAEPAKPAGNGSVTAWRAYAVAVGLPEDEVADMGRDDIKTRIASMEEETP